MWAILKFEKKNLFFLQDEFKKKLGPDFKFYIPKIQIKKFYKNKLIKKNFSLIGDYLFCYHDKFKNEHTIDSLKYTKGLKYFLSNFRNSQKNIEKFILKCKKFENNDGFITKNFLDIYVSKQYKFLSGPFANQVFDLMSLQKNRIEALVGNIKTTLKKEKFILSKI